jgi:hypothetical protein
MANDLPYLTTVKNLPGIFEKIHTAGTPPRFTREFLADTLGFKSSGDRGVIKVLKELGFLSSDGTPLSRYNEYRGAQRGKAIAQGLREGWSPVFLANQSANDLSTTELVEIFKNVTGKGEAVAKKMASTFRSLSDLADWEGSPPAAAKPQKEEQGGPEADAKETLLPPPIPKGGLSLHSDIHIHLPATSDVAVYTAIFRALRDELL